MLKKIALIGQSNTFEKPDLDSMPKDIVGATSPHLTADDLSTPAWTKFRDAFAKRWGHAPSAASEFSYDCMRMILRGIDKQNGDVSDKAALVKAMHNVDMADAPRGPVHLDQNNAAVENVYIREVAMGQDGTLYNKGLFTVKDVSQFGPYDPQIYMKQPPDTGKYPPDERSAMPVEMLKVEKEYEYVPFGQ
jgi:branched-chain amino acid transport system substrate-binding protein